MANRSGWRRFARLVLGAVLTTACNGPAIPSLAGDDPAAAVPAQPEAVWIGGASDLFKARFGRLRFRTRDGKRLSVYIYRATGFDQKEGPIWFVMHGAKRNARRYLNAAAPVAERYRALAVVIEFSRREYPHGNDYTLAVTSDGLVDESAWQEGRWRKPKEYLYTEIERLFDAVRCSLGGRQPGYYLFGHSAGAQFTHRLLTFMPGTRVLGAVAANAGWYTLPVRNKGARFAIPYGLFGGPPLDLESLLAAPLTLLLGTRDTATSSSDPLLRGTPEAMAQGATRLQRGTNYFETGGRVSATIGAPFGWRLVLAPGARHRLTEVITSAGYLLFQNDKPPCQSGSETDNGALVINEVLADPPRGTHGDVNHDGVRSARDDEFVEIVNSGATPVCLAGWTLTDANGRLRHLFPLGRVLEPGKALVIFGGGVPTGRFGKADVQWTTSDKGLSLTNAGDVLTLRDPDGVVVDRISWGDCASKPCAKEHMEVGLALSGSLVRWPELVGSLRLHRDVAGSNFSPGLRVDGSVW